MNTRLPETLPAAVSRSADRAADSTAVTMSGSNLSYGELVSRSNQVANVLRERGVQPGDRVGLYAHKSIDIVAGLHGIMKAGAGYVPVNPDAPAAYVEHILRDCDIKHLITGSSRRGILGKLSDDLGLLTYMGLEPDDGFADRTVTWDEVSAASTDEPGVAIDEYDLAYIIFTSGSTGKPKGIMHSHRSALGYSKASSTAFDFRPDDRITSHAPLNFDLSTLELFAGALAGSAVVMVPESHARLPASFSQLLQDERVTIVNAVPFALVQLLHRGALDERDLSAIRWVLFGGEVYPTRDIRGLMQALPHARFGNVYGPAEVNGCTYLVVPEIPPEANEPISIGWLFPGMDALVVDEHDNELGPGVVGEMLVSSDAHMISYWNQPELTESSRLRRTLDDGTTQVFYRTGDLVERQGDGSFRLLGRKDRQVQMRGHRVELDEVETALISHPKVEQAVVYAVPDGDGSVQIEAVVTLFEDAEVEERELSRHVSALLPKYALPRRLSIESSVPRTSTGKADRVKLIELARQRAETVDTDLQGISS